MSASCGEESRDSVSVLPVVVLSAPGEVAQSSSTTKVGYMHNGMSGPQPGALRLRTSPGMESASPVSPTERLSARLRNAATGFAFAVVLLVPKLLRLRRDPRSWLAFRILLGFAGAALVILPLAIWNSWLAGIAGLAMFLAAVLMRPTPPETSVDDKARELGALVVVNGGTYQLSATAPASPVQLFVGAETIWALNSQLRPATVLPVAQISSLTLHETPNAWLLRVRAADRTTDFLFTGIFAEHFARVAETTLRGVIPTPLPVVPLRRAARA